LGCSNGKPGIKKKKTADAKELPRIRAPQMAGDHPGKGKILTTRFEKMNQGEITIRKWTT